MAIVKLRYLKVGDKATILDDVQDESNALLLKEGSIIEIKSVSGELYNGQYRKCYVVADLMGQHFPLKLWEWQLDLLAAYMKRMVEVLSLNIVLMGLILLSLASAKYLSNSLLFPLPYIFALLLSVAFLCLSTQTPFFAYMRFCKELSFLQRKKVNNNGEI